ncbi:MAG: hypothetical protein ACK5ME_03210 [Parahaliea sp.]
MTASDINISNRDFLWNLVAALAALMISAALLLSAYLSLSPELHTQRDEGEKKAITERSFNGNSLIMRDGEGKYTKNETLQITALSDGRSLATSKTRINAADYPFIEADIENYHPRQYAYLIWRRADDSDTLHRTLLHWNNNAPIIQHLTKDANWSGTITEIGLDIYGEPRDNALIIHQLSFKPASIKKLLQTIWLEWTLMRGWSQKSAHHLIGSVKNPILSPTVTMASWAATATILLCLLARFKPKQYVTAYATAVFIPWLSLDALWQHELNLNLEESKYLYADKSMHEKHLAERDADLYLYAQHLKTKALPTPGARIFLLHDSDRRTYRRLKMQYYLLPHNSYNYDRFPQPNHSSAGDFILLLGKVPGLNYNTATQQLEWENYHLEVELIDNHEQGSLYRIQEKGEQ